MDASTPEAIDFLNKRRTKCSPDEWERFRALVASLKTVSRGKAVHFIQRADVDRCEQVSSIDGVLYRAADVTSYNNGNLGELCRRAEIISTPFPHLRAFHSWMGLSDSYGTKTFYAVRVGTSEFVCGDHVDYG